jgi:hypothetical protein
MQEISQEELDQLHNTPAGFYLKLFEPKDTEYYDKKRRKKIRYSILENQLRQTKAVKAIQKSFSCKHYEQIYLPDGWEVWRKK